MQKAVPVSEGGMIAVLGVDIQEVNKLINLSKKEVFVKLQMITQKAK